MECSTLNSFFSQHFLETSSTFFRALIKNGHVNLQMWVNELGFGSKKLKI